MSVLTPAQLNNPMEFENLRDAVITLFTANENDLFITVDHQIQSWSAERLKGTLRTIQVFVQSMDPESQTRTQFENEVTFGIYMRVAEPALGDVATLDNKNASSAAKQAALLAIDTGATRADRSWDELARIAQRIILSPLNEDLGLAEYVVSNRRFKNIRKDEPVNHGNLVVVTGAAFITGQVTEIMDGAVPVEMGDPSVKVQSNFITRSDADGVEQSKTEVDIANP